VTRALRKRSRDIAAEEEFPRRVEDLDIHYVLSTGTLPVFCQRISRWRGYPGAS
jgi:hypothetical protein